MNTHTDGLLPLGKEIFVFGSNLAGRHGGGAALVAKQRFGARYGYGVGHWGSSYAIPTKNKELKSLSLTNIKLYVDKFIEYAMENPNTEFFLTRIGCGLAGYTDSEIAPMFPVLPNIDYPHVWIPYISI